MAIRVGLHSVCLMFFDIYTETLSCKVPKLSERMCHTDLLMKLDWSLCKPVQTVSRRTEDTGAESRGDRKTYQTSTSQLFIM